jgi:hypothetical protein
VSLSFLPSLKLWGFPYLHMAEVFKAMPEDLRLERAAICRGLW